MQNSAKEKLISAAIKLFSSEGYGAVSIRQIAKQAGVNSSLISYYFNGKQGLYNATLENQLDSILQFTQKTTSENLSPEDIIKEYAYTIAAINKKSPFFIKILFREFLEPSDAFDNIITEKIKNLFDILSKAIKKGINEKIFRDDLEMNYTVLMIAGIINFYFFGTPVRTKITNDKLIDEIYLDKALNVIFHGIKNPKTNWKIIFCSYKGETLYEHK